MKVIKPDLPDFSNDRPPQLDLGIYESWVRRGATARTRASMRDEEIIADFMNNEGRMGETRYNG